VEFRILGPLEVRADGARLRLGGPRQERILAALLLDAGRVVGLGRLAEAVWDAEPPKTADRQVQNLVATLRRIFVGAGAPPDIIGTERHGYAIRIGRQQLDADQFTHLVETARRLRAEDPAAAIAAYRSGLRLWQGPALAGLTSRALEPAAAHWDEMRTAAWEECHTCELEVGRHGEVVGELAVLIDQHPFRERLTQLLMLALYRGGRQTEALAAYRDLRERLAEQLGLDPSEGSRALHDAILRRDPSLAAGGTAARAATAGPVLPVPAQLPADVTAFTGRQDHLNRLDSLGTDQHHLAMITGTAGVGKTALAVHWAHRARDRFADGQLYVNLRGYPIEALAGFLLALGVPPERIPVDAADAAALYRSQVADKRLLVLLDNARQADQIRPLLPGGSGCVAVVTARDAMLGLVATDGAETLSLDVLTADEAGELLVSLLGADRTAAEPEATVELARLCANLPLALRIAAAHLRNNTHETVAGLCARLRADGPLAALDVPGDRQAAVRAAIDLSYAAQPAPVQRLYRLLGLLPFGDFIVGAAGAVAGLAPRDASHGLDRLAEAHLVERRTYDRFGFHDLLRRYAGDRARAEEGDAERAAATRRFFDWYLHSADAAASLLYPHLLRLPVLAPAVEHQTTFDDAGQALAWLDAERPNLVAAVTHAAHHGPRPAAWQLADAVRGYFYLRMHAVDWIAIATATDAAATAEGDAQAQASTQFSLAMLPWRQGRHDEAIRHYEAALALCRSVSWREGETAALGSLGNVHRNAGRLALAAGRFRQVIQLDTLDGQRASALGNLGLICWELGQLTEAVEHLTQAIPRFRKVGSRSGEATVLANLGEVERVLGHPQEATDHLHAAATMHENVGHRAALGDTRRCLAEVRCDTGDHAAAIDLAESALSLALDAGHRRYEANARIALGTAHHWLGDHACALEQCMTALSVARAAGERYPEVKALIGAALAGLGPGTGSDPRLDGAAAHADEALAVARQTGYRMLEGLALTALAHIHLALGDTDRARDLGLRALEVHRSTGHHSGTADTVRLLNSVRNLG
jgi:DNA-binding SARP family transcriptional activator/tetratricopeptide (TPR) repeat protein